MFVRRFLMLGGSVGWEVFLLTSLLVLVEELSV